MLGWVFVVVVLAVVSFILHLTGWTPDSIFLRVIWDILLLLVALGLLTRMLILHKAGEKEALVKRIKELEDKIKNLMMK